MIVFRYIQGCILMLLSSCYTFANTQKIDLLDAYSLAVTNNPQWAAQKANYRAKIKAKTIGRSGLLPQVRGEIRYSTIQYDGTSVDFDLSADRIINCVEGVTQASVPTVTLGNALDGIECIFTSTTSDFANSSLTIQFSQALFRLDRWHEYKRSKSLSTHAKAELEQAKQDLILKTAQTYFNIFKAKAELNLAKSQLKALDFSLQLIKRRFEKGLSKSTSVHEAQARYDNNLGAIVLAEAAVANTREALANLTYQTKIDTTPLPQAIPLGMPNPPDMQEWVETAQTRSIEVQLAKLSSLVAKHNFKARQGARRPSVDFFATISETNSGGTTAILDEGRTSNRSFGIALSMPLYTGGLLSSQEQQALFQKKESLFILEHIKQDLEHTVRTQFRLVQAAVRRAQAQQLATNSSEKAYKAVEKGYKIGTHRITEFLDAQSTFFLARSEAIKAQYNYILETLKLKRLVGMLDEEDLRTLNSWLPPISKAERLHNSRNLKNTLPEYQDGFSTLTPQTKHQNNSEILEIEKDPPRTFLEALRKWMQGQ